ncbi:unnamed protein product [Tetraodon nigroviridis]|uniref:(spotted green pufferfish) hypothetical protein n=1 Tax=Tetraodon nigroviridis TaxID=99883 RepID=Q4SBZ2_TETNG|nr:unnamed protein product [Tetraodon nigroviridis]
MGSGNAPVLHQRARLAARLRGLLCRCHCPREQVPRTRRPVSGAVRFTCGLLRGKGHPDDVLRRVLVRKPSNCSRTRKT